ncbi:MAG: hypothetical protein WC755_01900 [Candidatus Woesearchaeota archaeon]
MGKAKPVKVVSEKTSSGSVKLPSPNVAVFQGNSVKNFRTTVITPPAPKSSGGCGCGRKK